MRRLLLVLAVLIPVAATLLLAGDAFGPGGLFGGASGTTGVDDVEVFFETEDDTSSDGPSLTGRADLAASAEAQRRLREGALGPDGGGAVAADASGAGIPFKGKVLDPNGRPAGGVRVTATGAGGTLEIATDDDGRFAGALPPGRYKLVLMAEGVGFRMMARYLIDGSRGDDLEIKLQAPGAVEVVVLHGDTGVSGVPVTLVARGFAEELTFERATDAEGLARFEDVPRMTYDLEAEVPDGPKILKKVGVGGRTTTHRLKIPDGVILQGKVTDGKDGPAVAGAEILLQVAQGGGTFQVSFASGADGTYEVMVPRGTMRRFEVTAEGFARWPNPASKSQRKALSRSLRGLRRNKPVTQDVALASGASVLGLVTDESGSPIPGIGLLLRQSRASSLHVETDEQGRYSAAELNPGRYQVMVETPGWFAEGKLYLDVPWNQTQPVTFDFTLRGSRKFEGVVLSAQSQPVFGARVWVFANSAPLRSARFAGRTLETFTGADGRFTLTDVPRDLDVALRASYGTEEATPVWVAKTKAVPGTLELQLDEAGAIEGACVDLQTRSPLVGTKIVVRPVGEPHGRAPRTVKARKDGTFRVGRLVPGSWSIEAKRAAYLPFDPLIVDVPASERPANGDVALDPGLVFQGVVTDAKGQPLKGATVDAQERLKDGKWRRRSRGYADAQGRFRLTGIQHHATFRLRVSRGGFRALLVPDLAGGEQGLAIEMKRR